MTREIKFRAKKINKNEFVIGYYLPMAEGYRHYIYLPLEYLNEHSRIEIDPKTLGQYTGLLDKNGKEVYEGDIIRIKPNPKDYGGYKGHNYIELVFWNDEEACYDIAIDRTWLLLKSDIEIIGNIYENPELITGGKNG